MVKQRAQTSTHSPVDDYFRLVNLVLSSSKFRLHTFASRLNKAMVSFNDMNFYTIGATSGGFSCSDAAVRNLNLFAGSLYLETPAI